MRKMVRVMGEVRTVNNRYPNSPGYVICMYQQPKANITILYGRYMTMKEKNLPRQNNFERIRPHHGRQRKKQSKEK